MKIVIVGAGEVGTHLSETLGLADHDVTVVERDLQRIQFLQEHLDARVIHSSGSSSRSLLKAGVQKCDIFLAMTSNDETNLVSSSLAKALGAERTFARVHDSTFRDSSIINYQKHFGIDHLVNPEALAAVELAKRIRNPGRVAVEDFGRGKIEVQAIEIKKGSRLIGPPLKNLKLPGSIRVGLISRDSKTTVGRADSTLEVGDTVTLFGEPNALFEAKPMFDPDSSVSRRIAITLLGGSEIAISLTRLLTNPRFKIRVIEENLELCRTLATAMPDVTLVHGEGTSLRLLEEEEVGHSDFFVACTKVDEDNIMTCIQASKLGAKSTMLAINRADYIEVIGKLNEPLGIDLAVSPRIAAANEVLRHIGKDNFIEIDKGQEDSICIVETEIQPGAEVVDKALRDIRWPGECVIVGLEHQHEAKMPTGDDVLRAKDQVVAIVSKQRMKDLLKLTQ